MDIIILDTDFKVIYILDTYESLLWIDRYYEPGEFEIYTPLDYKLLQYLREKYYLQIQDSNSIMIIEQVRITSGINDGQHLIISGRSLESILYRRVIYPEKEVSGNLQTVIQDFIKDCITDPKSEFGEYYGLRKIDNFEFVASTDPNVTSATVPTKTHTQGTILYDIIHEYCTENELGFRITLTDDNKFAFQLYSGADRSANQTDNRLILFAKEYDNISTSEFSSDYREYKNFVILSSNETILYYGDKTTAGLEHREDWYTCSGEAETQEDLDYYGYMEVNEKKPQNVLTAEVDPLNGQFVYGIDYFIGDIVQVGNELIEGQARITEYTINVTESGIEHYPTFEFMPVDD